jgi:hypothetical protein
MLLNKISKNGMFVNQYQYLLSWKLLQYCDKQTEQTKNLDNTEHQIKIVNSNKLMGKKIPIGRKNSKIKSID